VVSAVLLTSTVAPTPVAFAGNGGTGSDASLDEQKKTVQDKLDAARNALDDASAATIAARAELGRADAALPDAQAKAREAQGSAIGAQALVGAAQRGAAQAAADVAAAQQRLAASQAAVLQRRTVLTSYVRSTYVSGPIGTATMVLAGTDPAELLERDVAVRATSARLHGEVQALQYARLQVAQQQMELQRKQQAATALVQAQATTALRAQQAAAAAQGATYAVQSLIAQRAASLSKARTAEAADREQIATLQAQSQRIAALLAARPRPVTGPVVGPSGLLWPAAGTTGSGFGYRIDPYTHQRALHAGVDIAAPTGTPIYAAQAGTVAYAGPASGYGNYTCIDHGQGFATCYAHQSVIGVSVGEVVARGQQIGQVGSTGFSTGPHLHFETRVNGEPVDPMQYF
jgi:murein DD-endopeptidase MepM/ murein hydrolase activator NlpD